MRRLLPTGALARLLAAWLLASTGGWAFTVAVAVYAFNRSGTGAAGLVTAARLLPAVLAAPWAGLLVDRLGRGRVVAGACGTEALAIAAAAALMGAHGSLALIVLAAVASSAAATAPRPALEALMPALAATPDGLVRATAAWAAVDNAGFLVGAGAGGAAIGVVGAGALTWISAALFAGAAVLALSLPWIAATAADEPDTGDEGLRTALAGVRTLRATPGLRVAFLLLAGILLLEGTTDVQLVVLAIGHLGMGNGGPGELYAVWGVGGVIASGVLLVLVRLRGYGLALFLGALVFGGAVAVTGTGGVPIALVAMLVAGIGFALVESSVMALVPRLADDLVAGRLYGLAEVLYAGAAGIGALIAPALIRVLGASGSLAAVGSALVVVAVLVGATLARLDAGQEEASRVRGLLHGISFLTPLPLPRLERLVRAAERVRARAGATLVGSGEVGTHFYAIVSGEVAIVEYGRRQGPGTGFGEIALLRDVPRTATVRALTDVELVSLDRSAFLAAVSANGDAARLAQATASAHLARDRAAEPD